jgi:hypothetical protein
MKRKLTKKLIVHHSASPMARTTLDNIRAWHKEKGFTDDAGHCGYHYFINNAGIVQADRPEDEWGCAVKNANHDSISICVAGDFRTEFPTDFQMNALIKLLADLVKKYGLKYWNIYAHKDIKWLFVFNTTQTDCCGVHLYQQLPEIRRRVMYILTTQKPISKPIR